MPKTQKENPKVPKANRAKSKVPMFPRVPKTNPKEDPKVPKVPRVPNINLKEDPKVPKAPRVPKTTRS